MRETDQQSNHGKGEDAGSESESNKRETQRDSDQRQGRDVTSELKEWSLGHEYISSQGDPNNDSVYYVDVADAETQTQNSGQRRGSGEEECADAFCQTVLITRESCATQTVDFEGSVMRLQRAYSRWATLCMYVCMCVCVCVRVCANTS
jgi:hypothetical protein